MARGIGGWLSGPYTVPRTEAPGVRLGLPADGPGATATAGARIGAFLLDLFASFLIGSVGVLVVADHPTPGARNLAYDIAFVVQTIVLVSLTGQSIGMRLTGLRVASLRTGGPPGLGWTLLRTLLLVLIVPAVIWDRDRRGLHDRAAGTVVIRTR